MRPTETLRAEHRIIEKMLDCLEAAADDLEAGRPTVPADLRTLIGFFRAFADGVHHGKEEALLFPRMEARGVPSDRGPTACMRREHDDGRARLDGMDLALERREEDPGAGERAFVANVRMYAPMLRQHIQKEDHCLFSMADQLLAPADQADLAAQFRQVDHAGHGGELREYWLSYARTLCRQRGLALPAEPEATVEA